MLIIPDISFYQDNNATPQKVDFAKMKAAGAAGVIIRAGQNTWIDPDFADYWRSAKEAGLLRGSYWFFDSRSTPVKQADLWNSVFMNDYPELGAWMDFEERYGGSYGSEQHMQAFALRVDALLPSAVEVGVYTAPAWWAERVKSPSWWVKFPLWIANYGVSKPLVPKPWSIWTFWQYTAKGDGAMYGVESTSIDLNYFDGTVADLHSLFGVSQPVPPPPVPQPKAKVMLIEADGTVREFKEL